MWLSAGEHNSLYRHCTEYSSYAGIGYRNAARRPYPYSTYVEYSAGRSSQILAVAFRGNSTRSHIIRVYSFEVVTAGPVLKLPKGSDL